MAAAVHPTMRSQTVDRARRLAERVHAGQRNRRGEPMIEHVDRVAASVPPIARPVALVHDVCERSDLSPADVARVVGLSADETTALDAMTKRSGESVLDHTRRVAGDGPTYARALAVAVKRADLLDHIEQTEPDPVYVEAIGMLAARPVAPPQRHSITPAPLS